MSKVWAQCLFAGISAVRRTREVQMFKPPGFPKLTIYHIPSFIDATGWTICEKSREENYKLQKVIWHQEYDSQRIQDYMLGSSTYESPEPTVEEFSIDLESTWVENKLSQLAKITIPLHVKHPLGLDGESWGIRVPREFDVEWWGEGPDEWSELIEWTHSCVEHFRSLKS
jgi:hypothetical protein